jgi:pimeloyl-ACP methyl ester carboxylesterase
MANWSDGYVNANGMKLHYYRTGGNKPAVMISHGAGDDGLCWTHVVKGLETDYDFILPDARGHGKSSSGKGDYSSDQRVADLVALIEALKLERPVVGGHSMGADTSLNLAATHPHLARAVFLEDPPIMGPGEALFESEEFKGKDIAKMMRQFMQTFKLLPGFISMMLAKKMNPAYPKDELIPWVHSKQRVSFDFLNQMTQLEFDPAAQFEAIKKINVPVLLFTGDKAKMSIVSEATAAKIAALNPLVQVVHLEGASHDIRRTRFDGYLPALKQFLKDAYTV